MDAADRHPGPVDLTRRPRHATLLQRAEAALIDAFTILSTGWVLFWVLLGSLVDAQGEVVGLAVVGIAALLIWLVFGLLENTGVPGPWGKKQVGIVVTDLQGERARWWRVAIRQLVKVVSLPLFPVGMLLIAYGHRRQTLHDLIAGTLVVEDLVASGYRRQVRGPVDTSRRQGRPRRDPSDADQGIVWLPDHADGRPSPGPEDDRGEDG